MLFMEYSQIIVFVPFGYVRLSMVVIIGSFSLFIKCTPHIIALLT